MVYSILLALPVFFSFPGMNVRWIDNLHESVAVSVEGVDPRWERCVESGLQARYRIEVKLCRKRGGWMDSCLDSVLATRSVEKDPVSRMFKVSADFLNDAAEPEGQGYETYQEALAAMVSPVNVSLKQMFRENPAFAEEKKKYIRTRVSSACRGEVSPILRRLSQFLSFGLVDLQDRGSNWIDFDISLE